MASAGRFLLAFMVLTATYAAAEEGNSRNIQGVVFQKSHGRPLPGALVVMYDGLTHRRIDYTFTQDDGYFWLKAPEEKGVYRIVATRDMISRKRELAFDPGESYFFEIDLGEKDRGWISEAVIYIVQKYDYVITTLIGLFLGLGLKVIEERFKARKDQEKYIYTLSQFAGGIQSEKDQLETCLSTRTQGEIVGLYPSIVKEIENQIQQLEKHLAPDVFMEGLRQKKRRFRTRLHTQFLESVRLIRDFLTEPMDNVVSRDKQTRRDLFYRGFDMLKEGIETLDS